MATEQKIIFHGELQLTRWSESSTNGATVTFWVHPEDLESFKLLQARTGKKPGSRIAAAMTLIGDDEQVVEHHEEPAAAPSSAPPARRSYKPSMGECGMIAVRWCRDPDFQRWAAERNQDEGQYTEALAKLFILDVCGVCPKYGEQASRKHLDLDPECTRLFHERIRIPFHDWLSARGIQK